MPRLALFAMCALSACLIAFNVYASEKVLCTPRSLPGSIGNVNALVMCINGLNSRGGGTINLGGFTYTLPSGPYSMDGNNGLPDITSTIVIKNGIITKDRSLSFRHFHVSAPGSLSLRNVTLTNGNASSGMNGNNGGSIYVAAAGMLELYEATFSDNIASNIGGAIYVDVTGSLNYAENSIFLDNSAPSGGALYVDGNVTKIGATLFSGNSASQTSGGAVYITGNLDAITESYFFDNVAEESGGAIFRRRPRR